MTLIIRKINTHHTILESENIFIYTFLPTVTSYRNKIPMNKWVCMYHVVYGNVVLRENKWK